jgi:phosphate transport system protein
LEAALQAVQEGCAGAHTLKVFDEDLDQLRALVCEMGGRVETAITQAVDALRNRDEAGAAEVAVHHRRIEALAAEVEREAVRIIAVRAPVADDLRDVLAALRISALAARMGDCARNVARRVPLLAGCAEVGHLRLISELEARVSEMVKAALDAFVARDAAAAARIVAMDAPVDALCEAVFHALVEHMTHHHASITAGTHLLFVAQKLERVGDHAAAMARIVHFAATGEDTPEPMAEA